MADQPTPNVGAAADSLIQLAGKFQAVLDVAHALKGMSSVEGAIAERQAGLAKATADHEKAKADLATTEAALKRTQDVILKAESDHAQAMADLKAKTMAEARFEADRITAAAASGAAASLKSATDQIAAAQADHAAVMQGANARLAAAQKDSSEIEVSLAAARKEHETLTKKIADLKRSAAQLAA